MLRNLLISSALALGLGTAAVAQGGFLPDDVARFEVLPGWRTAGGTHISALRITLAPGWKTYWRAPGDAGIPPRFDWQGSRNLAAVAFHWPTPDVFEQNGMRTVGYKDELILPMELTPGAHGGDIRIQADVEIGVCQDICIPMSARISARLGSSTRPDARITAAISDRPATAREAGLKTAKCAVEPISDGLRVTATLDMPSLGRGEIAIFEHPDPTIWVAEAAATRTGPTLTAVTEMVPPSSKPFTLDRSKLRITVLGAGRAVDIWGCTG